MDGNITMDTPSCFYLRDPTFHQASERFTMNIITAIINTLTAPVAVTVNVLIVTAIFSCSRLRTPSNLLIASLAISDVFVALTVQPVYITYRLMENQHRSVPCFVRIVYNSAFFDCFGVSFMTLSAVSYEGFVTVRLRVRYNGFFSSRRVVMYMLTIWTLSIFLTALRWTKIKQAVLDTHLILWLICLLVSVTTQIGILRVVRRQRRQLQVQLQGAENLRRQREAKLAKHLSVIVGVYLILNFPVLFVTFYNNVLKLDLKTDNHYSWTETIAFINSYSNPFICCWKNRQVRQNVRNILKKIVCQ